MRFRFPESYGKYRHTAAMIRAGSGAAQATWSAEIPRSGRYRLEVFVAPRESESLFVWRYDRRTWTYRVRGAALEESRDLDADEVPPGWNELGEFELAKGEVDVSINDEAPDGRVVIADAVRWTPVGETRTESK